MNLNGVIKRMKKCEQDEKNCMAGLYKAGFGDLTRKE